MYTKDEFRSRNYRYSRQTTKNDKVDAVAVMLTAQIIVCIFILVTFYFIKRIDIPRYNNIKMNYDSIMSDQKEIVEFSTIAEDWNQGLELITMKIDNIVSEILIRINGGSRIKQPEVTAKEEISYDYLNPKGATGGWFGLEPEADQMVAPRGATLSPVLLGGKMLAPVEGIITSKYAFRVHPITNSMDYHTGIDIAAEEGRGILAALPGEVVEVGWSDIYGNYIVLQHATHLQTSYSHCSEIIAQEGMAVREGERIAKVGKTGTVTGAHLHFSVIVDGLFTDPFWVLGSNIKVVD